MGNTNDFDNPWKEALEFYFREFIALVAPDFHRKVDWSKAVSFLDSELRKLVRNAATGTRHVDRLARVRLVTGERAAVLAHIEVQAWFDGRLEERMFTYHYRVFDRFRLPVFSLCFLADARKGWRPDRYDNLFLGTGCSFRFRAVKLLDWQSRLEELERSSNPFAVILLAHLRALRTKADRSRLYWKTRLVRELLRKDFQRRDVLELFRLIDWLLFLPDVLQDEFDAEVCRIEEEHKVAYITSIERKALEEGRQKGRQEGRRNAILRILLARFGEVPVRVTSALSHNRTTEALDLLIERAALAATLAEFEAALEDATGPRGDSDSAGS